MLAESNQHTHTISYFPSSDLLPTQLEECFGEATL